MTDQIGRDTLVIVRDSSALDTMTVTYRTVYDAQDRVRATWHVAPSKLGFGLWLNTRYVSPALTLHDTVVYEVVGAIATA